MTRGKADCMTPLKNNLTRHEKYIHRNRNYTPAIFLQT